MPDSFQDLHGDVDLAVERWQASRFVNAGRRPVHGLTPAPFQNSGRFRGVHAASEQTNLCDGS
ncbi:MAG: hypothetical protein GY903_30960 [Fuerstiella sp.]|nr:hypothetical protein [Fuerstiella sp.]MCP4858912.1 hypothetical protein [Fuerstiella sp.]